MPTLTKALSRARSASAPHGDDLVVVAPGEQRIQRGVTIHDPLLGMVTPPPEITSGFVLTVTRTGEAAPYTGHFFDTVAEVESFIKAGALFAGVTSLDWQPVAEATEATDTPSAPDSPAPTPTPPTMTEPTQQD